MSYYARVTVNEDFLMHVNNNHDKLGRFAPGDGDGDGYLDDNHNKEHRNKEAKDKKNDSGDKDDKDQAAIAIGKYNVLSGSAKKASSSGQEALKTIYGDNAYHRQYEIDFSQMTDQEMQRAINRYMLEQRYNDTFNPKVKNESYANAEKFISTVGTAAATAATIIGLYNAIKSVRSLKSK